MAFDPIIFDTIDDVEYSITIDDQDTGNICYDTNENLKKVIKLALSKEEIVKCYEDISVNSSDTKVYDECDVGEDDKSRIIRLLNSLDRVANEINLIDPNNNTVENVSEKKKLFVKMAREIISEDSSSSEEEQSELVDNTRSMLGTIEATKIEDFEENNNLISSDTRIEPSAGIEETPKKIVEKPLPFFTRTNTVYDIGIVDTPNSCKTTIKTTQTETKDGVSTKNILERLITNIQTSKSAVKKTIAKTDIEIPINSNARYNMFYNSDNNNIDNVLGDYKNAIHKMKQLVSYEHSFFSPKVNGNSFIHIEPGSWAYTILGAKNGNGSFEKSEIEEYIEKNFNEYWTKKNELSVQFEKSAIERYITYSGMYNFGIEGDEIRSEQVDFTTNKDKLSIFNGLEGVKNVSINMYDDDDDTSFLFILSW
jgi:phage pi2 protein 07